MNIIRIKCKSINYQNLFFLLVRLVPKATYTLVNYAKSSICFIIELFVQKTKQKHKTKEKDGFMPTYRINRIL